MYFDRVFAYVIWNVDFLSHKFTIKTVTTIRFDFHSVTDKFTASFTRKNFDHRSDFSHLSSENLNYCVLDANDTLKMHKYSSLSWNIGLCSSVALTSQENCLPCTEIFPGSHNHRKFFSIQTNHVAI